MLMAVGNELVEEAGFAFVEALGVKGLLKAEELVIEVMADFVEESPQERSKGDHATLFRRPHP